MANDTNYCHIFRTTSTLFRTKEINNMGKQGKQNIALKLTLLKKL